MSSLECQECGSEEYRKEKKFDKNLCKFICKDCGELIKREKIVEGLSADWDEAGVVDEL